MTYETPPFWTCMFVFSWVENSLVVLVLKISRMRSRGLKWSLKHVTLHAIFSFVQFVQVELISSFLLLQWVEKHYRRPCSDILELGRAIVSVRRSFENMTRLISYLIHAVWPYPITSPRREIIIDLIAHERAKNKAYNAWALHNKEFWQRSHESDRN